MPYSYVSLHNGQTGVISELMSDGIWSSLLDPISGIDHTQHSVTRQTVSHGPRVFFQPFIYKKNRSTLKSLLIGIVLEINLSVCF